jgi:hypothetical protein
LAKTSKSFRKIRHFWGPVIKEEKAISLRPHDNVCVFCLVRNAMDPESKGKALVNGGQKPVILGCQKGVKIDDFSCSRHNTRGTGTENDCLT